MRACHSSRSSRSGDRWWPHRNNRRSAPSNSRSLSQSPAAASLPPSLATTSNCRPRAERRTPTQHRSQPDNETIRSPQERISASAASRSCIVELGQHRICHGFDRPSQHSDVRAHPDVGAGLVRQPPIPVDSVVRQRIQPERTRGHRGVGVEVQPAQHLRGNRRVDDVTAYAAGSSSVASSVAVPVDNVAGSCAAADIAHPVVQPRVPKTKRIVERGPQPRGRPHAAAHWSRGCR